MEAEKQKAECHAEHQRKAHIFSRAEMEVSAVEQIIYFDAYLSECLPH